jgi:hypothetical protein
MCGICSSHILGVAPLGHEPLLEVDYTKTSKKAYEDLEAYLLVSSCFDVLLDQDFMGETKKSEPGYVGSGLDGGKTRSTVLVASRGT